MTRQSVSEVFRSKLNTFFFRKILLVLIFILSIQNLLTAADSTQVTIKKADYFIDDEQKRIDLLDGKADEKIVFSDSTISILAVKVYFKFTDSLQRLLDR